MSSRADEPNGDLDTATEDASDAVYANAERDANGFEGVRMTITLLDTTAAQRLLRCLADDRNDASFTVDCVALDGTRPCSVTIDHVSEKQLEAARIAVENGYYDDPKEFSLSELAGTLGISESGASQRLRTLERKLIRSLVESCQ